jgi:hypothetical protein
MNGQEQIKPLPEWLVEIPPPTAGAASPPLPEWLKEVELPPLPEGMVEATPPTIPTQEKPSFLKELGGQFVDKVGGLAETGLAAASSIAAFPIGAAVKAGKLLTTAQQAAFKPPDFAEANRIGNKVAGALTYQPKTAFGQTTTAALAAPIVALQEGIRAGAKALRYDEQGQEALVAIGDVTIATLLPKLISETAKLGKVIPNALYERSIREVIKKGIDTGHPIEQMRVIEKAIREQVKPGTILEEVKRSAAVRKGEVKQALKVGEPAIETTAVPAETIVQPQPSVQTGKAKSVKIDPDGTTTITFADAKPVAEPTEMPSTAPNKPVEARSIATPAPPTGEILSPSEMGKAMRIPKLFMDTPIDELRQMVASGEGGEGAKAALDIRKDEAIPVQEKVAAPEEAQPTVEILPEYTKDMAEAEAEAERIKKEAEFQQGLKAGTVERTIVPKKPAHVFTEEQKIKLVKDIEALTSGNKMPGDWRKEPEQIGANRDELYTQVLQKFNPNKETLAHFVNNYARNIKSGFLKGRKERGLLGEQQLPEIKTGEGFMSVEPTRDMMPGAIAGQSGKPPGRVEIEKDIEAESTSRANALRDAVAKDLDDFQNSISDPREKAMFKQVRSGVLGNAGARELTASGVKISPATFNKYTEKWKGEVKARIEKVANGIVEKVNMETEASDKIDEMAMGKVSRDYENWEKDREGGFVKVPFTGGPSRFGNVKEGLNHFYQDVFDKFHAIKRASDVVKKEGLEVPVHKDPYMLARNYAGIQGKAEEKIFYKRFKIDEETGNVKFTGKSLQDIVKPAKEDIDKFSTYLVMRHVPEVNATGIETGVETSVAKSFTDQHKAQFEGRAKEFTEYHDALMDELVDAGRIAKETADTLKAKYPNYAALNRVIDDVVNYGYVPTSKKLLTKIPNPIKKLKGSDKPIIDPVESAIRATYVITNIAERQRIVKALLDLRKLSPTLQSQIKLVKPQMSQVAVLEDGTKIFRPSPSQKEGVVEFFENGDRHYYEVPKDLYEAMSQLSEVGTNWMIKMLRAPAQLLRAGATLTPEFAFRNPFRDQLQAYTNARYGYVPWLDFARGFWGLIAKPEWYHKWRAAGGDWSMLVSLDRASNQATLKKVLGDRDYKRYLKNPVSFLEDMSMFSEKPTRLGVMKRAKGVGVSDVESAFESREASTDFARRGAVTKSVSAIYTFLNARMQGTEKMFRTMKERPIPTLAKIITLVSIPSAILYLVNRDDDKYWEYPAWLRRTCWLIPIGGGRHVPMPKGEVGVLFGSSVESMMEFFDKSREGRVALDKMALNIMLELSPMGNVGETVPTAFRPMMEWFFNKNFFTKRPIVSRSLEAIKPEYQYESYTSESAKALGKRIGASPAKIENLTRGYLGGASSYLWSVGDAVLSEMGIVPTPKELPRQMQKIPGLKVFMPTDPTGFNSQSVADFYDAYGKFDQFKRTITKLNKDGLTTEAQGEIKKDKLNYSILVPPRGMNGNLEGEFTKNVDRLSEARKLRMKIINDKRLSMDEKTKYIDKLDERILKIVVPTMAKYRALKEWVKDNQ